MNNYGNLFGASVLGGVTGFLLIPLMIWSFVWKGWALWKAAKNNSQVWFIILLIVNTLGILEILYIFLFSKKLFTKVSSGKGKKK